MSAHGFYELKSQSHERSLDKIREAADLKERVIFTESAGRDRGEKFYEYERGGVPEYWLINPLAQRVEWYQTEGGQYHSVPVDTEHRYHSRVLPGFWLNVDWLWQSPLPHPVEVLGKIAGIDPQEIAHFLGRLKG